MKDRVVCVTGASSGIGAALSIKLGQAGAIPVLMARDEGRLQAVHEQAGGCGEWMVVDVTSVDQVNQAMERVIQKYGHIDVLVNNAGFGHFKSIRDTTLEECERMMDVNYMGAVRCTKAVLDHMIARKKGHIITVASLAGKSGFAKTAAYCASKHAVLGFMNSLRQEMLASACPIPVSTVNPGPVRTSFFDIADASGQYMSRLPSWFVLAPEQVADAIMKLIRKPKAEISMPWLGSVGVRWLQLFPNQSAGWINRFAGKK